MKSTDSTTINVFLWGGFVGKLSWDKDAMRSVFSFSEEYIDAPYDISPLKVDFRINPPNHLNLGDGRIRTHETSGAIRYLTNGPASKRFHSMKTDLC